MNYDKLTVERFAERLKANEYDGLTGARRAIGKARWTEKERAAARALAEAHCGTDGGKSAPKRAAKKRTAAPKKSAAVKPQKRAYVRKAVPATAEAAQSPAKPAETPRRVVHTITTAVTAPLAGTAPPFHLEEATRANSAALVIQAMRGTGALTTLEQRTYAIAQEEYWASARESARKAVAIATNGVPIPAGFNAPSPGTHVTAPVGTVPRIPVNPAPTPNGEAEEELTPEEQAQYEKLQRGLAALPAILGHSTT